MSSDKPNGVGLPAVAAIALGAAILGGLLVSGLNALTFGGRMESDATVETEESLAPTEESVASDSESDPVQGANLADSYIR